MRDEQHPFSASEARRRKTRAAGSAGTSFYIDRGRSFVTMRTYRERKRDPESQLAVSLANEITNLTERYPRFQLYLNQIKYRVLLQVRSPQWKAKAILKCLRSDQVSSINELIDRTKLDFPNVSATLEQLKSAGLVTECNRAGGPVNPDKKIYWRRKS